MNQDLLIIIGAAGFATALLIVGLMWEVRRSRRPLKVRSTPPSRQVDGPRPAPPTAATVATAAAAATPRKRRGPLDAVRDLVDASIAMYAVRRLFGWDTTPRSQRSQIPLDYLDEDVVASRIGAVAATGPVIRRPTRLVVAGSAVEAAPAAGAAAAVAVAPGPDRRRLLRDSFGAAAIVAAVLLIAVTVWPRTFQGGVLGDTGTPDPSVAAVVDVSASPADTATPTPDPTASPTPDGSPIGDAVRGTDPHALADTRADRDADTDARRPAATARPTPRPTAAATVAPTPKPTPSRPRSRRPSPPRSPPPSRPEPTPAPPVASFTWGNLLLVVSFDGSSSLGESTYTWTSATAEVPAPRPPSTRISNPGTTR